MHHTHSPTVYTPDYQHTAQSIAVGIALAILLVLAPISTAYADEEGPDVSGAIDSIDFSSVDGYLESVQLTDSISVGEIIERVIQSGYSMDVIVDVFSISTWFADIGSTFISMLCTLIFIMLCCAIVNSISPNEQSNRVVEMVTVVFAILVSLPAIRDCADAALLVYDEVSRFSSVMIPLLCTILTIMGGIGSAGLTQALVLLVDTTLMEAITRIIMPLITVTIAMGIIAPLSSRAWLGSIQSTLSSAIKWSLGLCVTIVTTIFSVRGSAVAASDGIMLKTAEYAISDLVPVVGRSISKITGVMMGGIVMVKNAFGSISITILVARCLSPVLLIIVYLVMYRIAAAIALMFENKKMNSLCNSISSGLILYLVVAVSVIVIVIVIIISSVNAANRILAYI